MKNKILKKFLIFGLVCSMSMTMLPASVTAAGTRTESETKESQSESAKTEGHQEETKKEEKSQPDVKKAVAVKEEPKQAETVAEEPKESETGAEKPKTEEPGQGETTQPEIQGSVEQILDMPTAGTKASDRLKIDGGVEGTDYEYTRAEDSEDGQVLLVIKTGKALKVTGDGRDLVGRIVVEAPEAKLTLSNVSLISKGTPSLRVEEGKKLQLTVSGVNTLMVNVGDDAAASLEADAELTIGGTGQLNLEGQGTNRDIYMARTRIEVKDGKEKEIDAPSSLKITDGTITAEAGIMVQDAGALSVPVQITGGSVDLKTLSSADKKKIKMTGSDGNEVHKVSLLLDAAEEQIEDITARCDGRDYAYGNEGIYTNIDKKIFLYLPAGQVSVTAWDVEYAETVESMKNKPETTTELKKAKAVVTAAPVVIPSLDYGYGADKITDVPIVVKNISINEAVIKSAQLIEVRKDDVKITTSAPFKFTAPTDRKVPGQKENTSFTVRPSEGLTAGEYKATLEITMEGDTDSIRTSITFVVNKVKVTATAKIDEKIYDGKRAAEGTVTIKGGVNGETPQVDESRATFTFNNANVKEANEVTVKNLVLTDEWAKNYELAETEIKVKGKIKKAPNKHTKADLKAPVVKAVYNSSKGIWQPQLTTYKGQEYLFFGSSRTSLTAKNKKSTNWKFGTKATVKDRLVAIMGTKDKKEVEVGLKAGVTYTVWTRFAGDDNHEPSDGEVLAYTTFTSGTGNTSNSGSNKISGLVEGTTYKTGSRLAFGAVGAGMTNTSPKEGDERYLPVSWKVSDEHSWSSAPYEAAFTINQAGSYTLQVTFRRQTYKNGAWTNTDTTTVTSVNFKMAATGTNGTGYSTSSNTTTTNTGSNSTTRSVTNTAAKTGDESPILPLAVVCIVSVLVIAGILLKKRSNKK